MTKTFCDRCGRQDVTSLIELFDACENVHSRRTFDLCNECKNEFFKWIDAWKREVPT